MKYFYQKFGKHNHESEQGEMFVKCPFPHTDSTTGKTYFETNASAHINVDKNVFHCKVCDMGLSEAQFIMKDKSVTYPEAIRILDMFKDEGDEWQQWQDNLDDSPQTLEIIESLGLTPVKDQLRLGFMGEGVGFPVIIYGEYQYAMQYRPNGEPKALLPEKAPQAIFPFDLWQRDEKPTLLCAGFKDAAIARRFGFNAITFTHGERSFPKLFRFSFKGKKVYIAYDNDFAGHEGALSTATKLKEAGASPYIVNLSTVCAEKGEDIHDFFMKYKKSSEDLQNILDQTSPFSEEDYNTERNKIYPLVSLQEATHAKYTKRIISSRISTIATYEESMEIPDYVNLVKVIPPTDKCTMELGESVTWSLTEKNLDDMLYLCDKNLKKDQVDAHLKRIAGVPKNELGIQIRYRSRRTVWKAVVTDDAETELINDSGETYKPAELLVYSLDNRLDNSEKYRIFYLRTPHPLDEMKNVGIVTRIEESDTSVNRFKVDDEVLDSLKCFQGETEKKMEELFERAKGIVGPELNRDIFFSTELFYHTPLNFHFGKRKDERATMEVFIVGESSTGKSRTAKELLKTYELGRFISLKNATTPALIGGTDKSTNRTRLGAIPRSHKSAVILEEFSGAPQGFIKAMTDMRTSSTVRIERVGGAMTVPAKVRMLTLSNQKTGSGGLSIPLRQYPNGVKVLLDLVGAAEDIRRYDFFTIIDKPNHTGYISPLEETEAEAYPLDSYRNRIRWIWSRKADQITMNRETMEYVVRCAQKLNERYDNHIQFFGAEGWLKLARVSIAVAACVASHDDSGENLIVKQEHVAWAARFLKERYDNDLFKLKEYVEEERKYNECPPSSVQALQGLYNRHQTLIDFIEQSSEISQTHLRTVSGLSQEDFSEIMNRLVACCFIHLGEKVVASVRFRKAFTQLNKSQYMKKVGEE